MSVLIVIVNYRSANLAIACLHSLAPEVAAAPGARVIVTDNSSGDGSVAQLEAAVREHQWSDWVAIQPLDRNGGFAYGNNAAVQPALASGDPPRFLWLLNPDTLVRPGALKALVDFLDARPDVGLAGSRLEHRDGSPQRSAFCFPSIASEFEGAIRMRLVTRALRRWVGRPECPESPCPTDWAAGASLMVRREVFETVGLLDEHYFMYYEEVDFCRKARDAGWPCWYVPASRVVHLVGQSSGVNDVNVVSSSRRPRYWFEARRRYFRKHHGFLGTLVADLAFAIGFALFRIRSALLRKPMVESQRLLWDFVQFNLVPLPIPNKRTP